jgi:hypothetical protein
LRLNRFVVLFALGADVFQMLGDYDVTILNRAACGLLVFAAEEREATLDQLGGMLQRVEKHADFTALAAKIDRAAPRPNRENAADIRRSPRNPGRARCVFRPPASSVTRFHLE